MYWRSFTLSNLWDCRRNIKKRAEAVATTISKHQCFGDIKLLTDKIETKVSIHKKLMKLEKLGNLHSLTSKNIKKLESLGKKKKAPINLQDGKIQFETEEDIDNVIKLLCDYFKTGDYSGKPYGTYAGKLQPTE